ncbi:Transcription factor vib-1 [Escovopsis weberi]|uniref:Transcription factor vib-1 n=1 Tax=Escovopsis weberi TaxID=150374 RepID=A0A0M9VT10_ESCWE|nr:Transcription factor vib-1 [Escovopsis weberi]
MDANQYGSRAAAVTVPPLLSVQTTGTLQFPDGTPIKVDITGTVDKGFFLAEGEWTCYRRNYMACNCSYSLHPHYTGATIQYLPSGSEHPYQVYGFSMCISAVVADNDQHSIELVQHTPKRDKGPISKPERVPLAPKNSVPSHHSSIYSEGSVASGARSMYSDGFGGNQASGHPATEHTFERIQFKQATQNNGRRRAAQQYYHLMVELWADLGTQMSEKWVKVAFRKSEKMIVRGRSPGHYQNGKSRSHSSGPGGSAGTLGYGSISDLTNFSASSIVAPSGSYTTSSYEPSRGAMYGSARHHDLSTDTTMSSEDEKGAGGSKGYHYYPGTLYEGSAPRVDMFSHHHHHHRSETEPSNSHLGSDKVKSEYDLSIMPRVFHPPPMADLRRQNGPFDGKATSAGYYPTMMTPPGANLTMP